MPSVRKEKEKDTIFSEHYDTMGLYNKFSFASDLIVRLDVIDQIIRKTILVYQQILDDETMSKLYKIEDLVSKLEHEVGCTAREMGEEVQACTLGYKGE